MSEGAHPSENQPRTAPVYIVREGEMILNAPLQRVWRLLLDYPTWQNYSIVKRVSGVPGQEGEVVYLKKEEGKLQTTAYYARTIKVDPGRRIVWKTFRDNVNGFGIVEFKVFDLGSGQTRFCHSTIYEHNVPYESEADLETFRDKQHDHMEALSTTIFAKLKVLAESNAE